MALRGHGWARGVGMGGWYEALLVGWSHGTYRRAVWRKAARESPQVRDEAATPAPPNTTLATTFRVPFPFTFTPTSIHRHST